jgi:hypothetical protein
MRLQYHDEREVEAAMTQWMSAWNPYLIRQGFKPAAQTDRAITYVGRYLTVPRFLLGLVVFPFGILIWLFAKKDQGLTVTFEPTASGSLWTISGEAITRVRQMFLRSGFQPQKDKAPHSSGAIR